MDEPEENNETMVVKYTEEDVEMKEELQRIITGDWMQPGKEQ